MSSSWSKRLRRPAKPRLAPAIAASLVLQATMLVPDAVAQQPPRYYSPSELDAVPGIMTRVDPEYPQLARVSGKVQIRLFIDERGVVERVAVLRAEPRGYFEASAQRAFLAARFTPGMKAGKPVKTQLTLQVDYQYPK